MDRTLEGRLQTFSKSKGSKSTSKTSSSLGWPHPNNYTANPQSLAEAGFFFAPDKDSPDNVRCFMCDKELDGWDKGDNPFEIHVSKSPKCPWAIARCSLEFDVDQDGNFSIKNPSRLPMNRLLEKARLDTFGGKQKWWPHDSVLNHGAISKNMAKAGFVYTPQAPGDDTATCFYCDLSLSGWDADDDPAEEHRKREERSGKPCPFFHAKVQIAPSGSKAAFRKSKAAPKRTEPQTEVSEAEYVVLATTAKKSKHKSTVNGSMGPPPSNVSSTVGRKKTAKTYASQDEESQTEDLGASKSTRKGGKSKSVAKDKALEIVSEEEVESRLQRSKPTAAAKKAGSEKPPSNVNGKVAKQQQYTDVTIGLNDEDVEREGRGLARSKSGRSRSKSKPRSTASSRSRSRARATTDTEDEEGEEELEKPKSRAKAKRKTKVNPVIVEESDVEEAPATTTSKSSTKAKANRRTKGKKVAESDVEEPASVTKPTSKKPPSNARSTAVTAASRAPSRQPSENPPSSSNAMDVDEQKKGLASKRKGASNKPTPSTRPRDAQRPREPSHGAEGAEEHLETLHEEEFNDAMGMQVDVDDIPRLPDEPEDPPAPSPTAAPVPMKPASNPIEEKNIHRSKSRALKGADEVAETDQSAPPSRPVSITEAPKLEYQKSRSRLKGDGKGESLREGEATEIEVDMSVSSAMNAMPALAVNGSAEENEPVLQPAAQILSDKSGHRTTSTVKVSQQMERSVPEFALRSPSPGPLRPPSPSHDPLTQNSPLTSPFLPASDPNSTSPLPFFTPPLASSPLYPSRPLTDAERAMTVEQWIRHEMAAQYAALKRDGELRIAKFREEAEEVRKKIEAL